MKRLLRTLLALLAGATTLACCGDPGGAWGGTDAASADARVSLDATAPSLDASAGARDAGATADAGVPADASAPRDAGATSDAGNGDKTLPAELLDLTNWKLTLPVDTSHAGSPDEIKQPELATFSDHSYFHLNTAEDGVVFRAHCGGATTSNSGYPRSELREMANGGKDNARWSTSAGTHTLVVRQAITHLPVAKPHVVAAQIHDASDDVVMVRLEGSHLFIESGGDEVGTLDPAYVLGTVYTVKIEAADGHIRVWYDGVQKVDLTTTAVDCYFKAGCYTQSNLGTGDEVDAYGEVVIHDLAVTHQP